MMQAPDKPLQPGNEEPWRAWLEEHGPVSRKRQPGLLASVRRRREVETGQRGNWVVVFENGPDWTEALDGVPVADTDPPRRRHRCQPQARQEVDGIYFEHCRCGAVWNGGWWTERNTRLGLARWRRAVRKVVLAGAKPPHPR